MKSQGGLSDEEKQELRKQVERPMPKCEICGDTGVIETGHDDLPCGCAAGDAALFNVTEIGGLITITGAEMRRRYFR